jgi:arylsulfatase A-like enzyme
VALACSGDSKPAPPNILLYIVDTLRADAVGSYGNERASTPSIDAFARRGVLFENAFANASWTRASVATLLTGLLPWHHGAESRQDRLSDSVPTLADIFARHGYTTALVTANPNAGKAFGFARSFARSIELYARHDTGKVEPAELVTSSDTITRKALEWIDEVDEPFLLVVLAIDPHAPYTPPARFDAQPAETDLPHVTGSLSSINRPDLSARDRARIRELYQAEVAFNDESFGALLAGLEERGLARNTVVALTADHGEEFWEHGRRGHGHSLVDELLRVPLVIAHPGDPRLEADHRVSQPVQLTDIMPTLLDLAGLPIPPALDGRSLFPRSAADDIPLLAGVRLDEKDLVAARRPPWKLVWDRKTGTRQLYRLDGSAPEREAIDPSATPEARQAERELLGLLEIAAATDRPGARARVGVGEIPAAVQESLRALGYEQ